jgi:TetR/AcrR family transcriptional regulator, transcriptional repressor for nem operon
MARGDETRARILEGARELIHTRSYNAVGVLQICSHAGVKKGSFYYFFPSKQALAFEMLGAMWEAETRDVLAPAYDSDLPPLERIARHALLRHDASAREQEAVGAVRGCPFGGARHRDERR